MLRRNVLCPEDYLASSFASDWRLLPQTLMKRALVDYFKHINGCTIWLNNSLFFSYVCYQPCLMLSIFYTSEDHTFHYSDRD